jgi:tRNA uridine 5-carboxymethylaminomethyl modification enzyme
MTQRYDVIVIGAGHAGVEAAVLSARAGARTLLLTQNLETIGQMSCNPAIGGIAKGTVVREVDALGGVMGRATDQARIQFRMLNRSKGPAVWSPRAQCDRGLYRRAVRSILERQRNVDTAQGTVAGLVISAGSVCGVRTSDGKSWHCAATVLTAGTFLRGRIHLGNTASIPAGRAGEGPAVELGEALEGMGLVMGRFKTGTPPRIDGRSVDFTRLVRQDGDPEPYWFSHHERAAHPLQLPCWLTRSGEELRDIIRAHLGESALYGGAISGRGPRYCPSIEDKIVKFPDVSGHQIFLEPEGLDTSEMYVNGLSTSLPPSVQVRFLQTVPGLEQVRMTRPGYAIEYDFFDPRQLSSTLEVKALPGLFLAGQVNGTTGYEEAAGQGAVAGLNAAATALGREGVTFARDTAFLGVLIDDLVHRGVDEPYRLFTSRAEYRLLLRQDNALRRLLPVAEQLELLDAGELAAAHSRLGREDEVLARAQGLTLDPTAANPILRAADSSAISQRERLAVLARRPNMPLRQLFAAAGEDLDDEASQWAGIELKYSGYLQRERTAAHRLSQMSGFFLPGDLEYAQLTTLSFEARERLSLVKPRSLGEAARVPGVSPSDLQCLITEVLKRRRALRFM